MDVKPNLIEPTDPGPISTSTESIIERDVISGGDTYIEGAGEGITRDLKGL